MDIVPLPMQAHTPLLSNPNCCHPEVFDWLEKTTL
jgi:hypothetical protein